MKRNERWLAWIIDESIDEGAALPFARGNRPDRKDQTAVAGRAPTLRVMPARPTAGRAATAVRAAMPV
jgi:hypothetical protein